MSATTTISAIHHLNDDSSNSENFFLDTLLSMMTAKMSHYETSNTENNNNNREITIVASTVCVFILLLVVLCVACMVRRNIVKNKIKAKLCSLFLDTNKQQPIQTEAIPGTSGGSKIILAPVSSVSSCSDDSFKSGIFEHFFKRKGKMSSLDSNTGEKGYNKSTRSPKLQPHKNIITPDKNIAFVVPTVR